jgi:molybdopterin molybdotransferase
MRRTIDVKEFYIDFERAIDIVLSNAPSNLSFEEIPVFDSLHRVLAEDVVAIRDNPPVSVSAMDGYGIKYEKGVNVPVKLKIIGEIPAGEIPAVKLSEGEAVKIFTGSMIPEGCDVVVPVEYTREENGFVLIQKLFPEGSNIRERGEDVKKGLTILKKGTFITPVEMGLIATADKDWVKVSVKPKVGIIVTGNEIVEPGGNLRRASDVINSNAYIIYGLVKEAGGEPVYFGIANDNKDATMRLVSDALESCDIVITSGGISMGKYDFVREVLPLVQVEPLFYKVRVKPGKPVFFGKAGKKFIFCLPGFPVSTVVSFNNFVFPFIRKMLGAEKLFRKKIKAVLLKDFKRKKSDRLEFIRCKYVFDLHSGMYGVFPLKKQGSGVLSAMVGDVGLMVVPEGVNFIKSGNFVDLILVKE